jgi:hypothetical protein
MFYLLSLFGHQYLISSVIHFIVHAIDSISRQKGYK